ncbi:MAG: MBL fold metallo-hydrolase [Deltaproteobacteria bacterium]|nr:MBL fold metallo-hydrolase [Deltaproteobacteria bacterium]MBW2151202.1 MBL fold metallo-hydrolase [Deltaproteobacteria bacterium]
MEHVKDNVYAELISPGCNVGIITTEKGTVIVDTPLLLSQAKAIRDELASQNQKPVRFIIISHPHGDHIIGTDLFEQDVLIIGNRKAYEKMGKHDPSWVREWVKSWNWENQDEIEEMAAAHISVPEIIFASELTMELAGVEIQILPLPGHMAEVVGVFVPKAGVLITGDALFNEHHPYMGEANVALWLESLEKMRALKPARIIPGHGPVCGLEAVDRQQRYMEKIIAIRESWNPEEGEKTINAHALSEIISYYPLHGRPEEMMRARIVESIRVAGQPRF